MGGRVREGHSGSGLREWVQRAAVTLPRDFLKECVFCLRLASVASCIPFCYSAEIRPLFLAQSLEVSS